LECLKMQSVDLVMLLGYMKRIGPLTMSEYQGRMLNIHPALLPKYGGPGMYGIRVHQEVLRNRERESGATIHAVTSEYDSGPIICQRMVDVHQNDNAESLAARVLS